MVEEKGEEVNGAAEENEKTKIHPHGVVTRSSWPLLIALNALAGRDLLFLVLEPAALG